MIVLAIFLAALTYALIRSKKKLRTLLYTLGGFILVAFVAAEIAESLSGFSPEAAGEVAAAPALLTAAVVALIHSRRSIPAKQDAPVAAEDPAAPGTEENPASFG